MGRTVSTVSPSVGGAGGGGAEFETVETVQARLQRSLTPLKWGVNENPVPQARNWRLRPVPPRRGFTLIELILVMAMLVIILSVAAPSLARFFRGRSLDSEARRFVSLTRYAQSRAASEGVPMVLWIDPRQGAYGLEADASYTETDRHAVEFRFGDDLQMEVELPATKARSSQRNRSAQFKGNLPAIRFTPDGFIGESSPERIVMRQGEDGVIWIGQSRNQLNYEIQTDPLPGFRR
jgi:type II secretion system protein H